MTTTTCASERAALLCLAAALSVLACQERKTPELPPPAGVLLDPQVVLVDRATPFTEFDGSHGSIHFAEGWSGFDKEEGDGFFDEPYHYAWITKGGARLEIERPPAPEVDFYAECRPYPDAKPAPLELVLELDGHVLARHVMDEGWQSVRSELPNAALAQGVLSFLLRARQQRTSTELDAAEDERLFRATCRRIALVPRQVEDPAGFVHATRIDPASRRLRVARGGLVALPLPPGSGVKLDLAALAASNWG